MPRRNTAKHGRRRTAKALPPKDVAAVVSLEELALELVRRGRASEAILDHPQSRHDRSKGNRPHDDR
jgi:hypothetical protein